MDRCVTPAHVTGQGELFRSGQAGYVWWGEDDELPIGFIPTGIERADELGQLRLLVDNCPFD